MAFMEGAMRFVARFAMRYFAMRLFVQRLFAICAAVLALTAGPRPASAELMYNFQVGTWSAGAFTKQNTRQFNHCAASANYNSGILMSFSVSRSFAWSMAFAHPSWRLTQGQTYDIAFTVDQMSPLRARAVAVGPNLVEVPLADSTELFQRFRQGYQLRVAAAGQVFAFNLNGTSQVLPALLRCVQANLQPAGTTTVAANPFAAAPAPANSTSQRSNGAGQERPAAYRAEALSLAANILGSAGIVGFQIAEGDNGFVDAAWRANRLFGMVRIEPKEPPALISAGMIAVDAAGCKSKFASGSIPASGNNDVPRMFTKCGDGDQGYTVFYFILPRKAGGHYLIGTGTSGAEEPARQVESDIRQATLKVTGR
jgi:hypothetical protein